MHWRRFRVDEIPLGNEKVFGDWVLARWREKDDLLQYYLENNRFPADDGVTVDEDGKEHKGAGWIETEVRPANAAEWMKIFVPWAAAALVINVIVKMTRLVGTTLRLR